MLRSLRLTAARSSASSRSASAFGNLQFATGVEAGTFLDHEGCHHPAPFGLDRREAETLARLDRLPDRDSDDLVAVGRVALVRTQHPFGELAGSPRTSELIPCAGLQSPCRDPDKCLIEFHHPAWGNGRRSTSALTYVRRSAERTSSYLPSHLLTFAWFAAIHFC